MHYEINVSKLGVGNRYAHFFATAERSITDSHRCETVYKELVKAFPEPEYQISISRIETVGYSIDPSDIHDRGDKNG